MQVFNPYLPEGEYFPDGEIRVFNDRVYLYASHDRFNSCRYCSGDFVIWSAPVDDLSAWRKETTYKRKGVAHNIFGFRCMWAPDCVQGPNGRYYLYYCFDFKNFINVAVSDNPGGPFSYYGIVSHKNGKPYGREKGDIMCFDPAVLVDGNDVFLYSGYSANEPLRKMLWWKGIRNVDGTGGQVVSLMNDMITIKAPPKQLIPGYKNSAGTGFEGHEMYEASSIRKIGRRYYFVYSSRLSHELCYAISDYPDKDFVYGGTLISNGDIGYQGRREDEAVYYWGNNHGCLAEIQGKWYVFYHRQTNHTEQCRQGCAEKIEIGNDGTIRQVNITSCGLNNGPLNGKGEFGSYIACNLWSVQGAVKCAYGMFSKHKYRLHPYITEENKRQYIRSIRQGSVVGFKYFKIDCSSIDVIVRGDEGRLFVLTDPKGKAVAKIELMKSKNWTAFHAELRLKSPSTALYFEYHGRGKIDFLSFTLN